MDHREDFPLPNQAEFDPSSVEAGILQLSDRQHAILAWMAHGKTNAEISAIFSLGRNTIEREVSRILQALGAENRFCAATTYHFWTAHNYQNGARA